jgi:acetylornithine/N-succinyldiaminopimelate aminotransferase
VPDRLMSTYARQPLEIVRGLGSRVWDADGRSYLDFLGGIAVNGVGHCHPTVVEAIRAQAGELLHCSNLYHSRPASRLAQELVDRGVGERVFLCNSGAEANEGAFKLVRKHFHRLGQTRRVRLVAMQGSFHGRTLATLAATDRPDFRAGFGPMPEGFTFVPFGDVQALAEVLDETVAAVVVEPIQGEGGIRVPPPDFLSQVRRLCNGTGCLLVADEVQTGMGRTGSFLASHDADVVTLAKGLGGGLPIGALGARGPAAEALQPGDHGSTFGGNPLCCAAALATLKVLSEEGLLQNATDMGKLLMDELRRAIPSAQVRGRGLMVGIELPFEGGPVVTLARQSGLLLNVTARRVVRLLPPLNVSEEEVLTAARIVGEAVEAARAAAETPVANPSG